MAHGHVLIIDDELRADDALAKCLSFDGFTVECARTGAEGLARAAAVHPDAIVLDLRLPDILGLSVLSELRRARLGVPVVVLTGAFLDEGHEVAARALGAAVYLHKPIIGDELTVALRSAIIAPPPEVVAPLLPNDVPKRAPHSGRFSDALSALHFRILNHDPTAEGEFVGLAVPVLEQRLRRRWAAVPDDAKHDAAVDAVMHYLRHPEVFDGTRGVPLEAFLYGIAHRKLRDRVNADAARRRREQDWWRRVAIPERDPEARAVVADLLLSIAKLVDSAAEIRALKHLLAGDQQKLSKALRKRLKDRIRKRALKFGSLRRRKRVVDSQ